MSHYEQRLEQDVGQLRAKLKSMGESVVVQIDDCTKALFARDRPLLNLIVIRDAITNRQMREIDHLCYTFIARHIPTGGLLRLVASIIRVNIQLERVGDYVVTIARSAQRLDKPPAGIILRELHSLSDESRRMLIQSVEAFSAEDDALARATAHMHDHLEVSLDSVYEELFSDIGNRNHREITAFFVIFNMLKRIADQAKNISEQAIFAVTGETKEARVYRVLFLDEDNSALGPLAVAVAMRSFGQSGEFLTAGKAKGELNAGLSSFLDQHGIDSSGVKNAAISELGPNCGDADIVISLQGTVADYMQEVPFHTAVFDWAISGSKSNGIDLESAYRELAAHLQDLMEIISSQQERYS